MRITKEVHRAVIPPRVLKPSMKAKVLQIVWHEKEPVYSVDFHVSGFLATAGADKEVKVRSDLKTSLCCANIHLSVERILMPCIHMSQFWQLRVDAEGDIQATHLQSLDGPSRTLNCIRFSPDGMKCALRLVALMTGVMLAGLHKPPVPEAACQITTYQLQQELSWSLAVMVGRFCSGNQEISTTCWIGKFPQYSGQHPARPRSPGIIASLL